MNLLGVVGCVVVAVIICFEIVTFLVVLRNRRATHSQIRVPQWRDSRILLRMLNRRFNSNPLRHSHDPYGFEKCMVFMHVFDLQTYGTKKPWFPDTKMNLRDLIRHFTGVSVPVHLPTFSVSFSAMNRNILPDHAQVLFSVDNECSGMIFAYGDKVNDRTISPMCFFPRDGSTGLRANCGCSASFGVQTRRPRYSPSGYMHQLRRRSGTMTLFPQRPLRFKEFVRTLMKHKLMGYGKRTMWNEATFPNWTGVDATVPLVAFFAIDEPNSLKSAVHVRDAFARDTGNLLPVVTFDANRKKPYQLYDLPSTLSTA